MSDEVSVIGLRVWSHIGVTAMERAAAQPLEIDIRVVPANPLTGLEDRIEGTVNYDTLRDAALKEARRRPRSLLETLAEDIALRAGDTCAILQITVTIRKYYYLDCQSVGISITRNIEKNES